jgi:tetratricopeptide (TPR) repeat protein
LRFQNVRHIDFTSRPMIESVAAKMLDEATARRRRFFETLARQLSAFLDAHLGNDAKAAEFPGGQTVDTPDTKAVFKKERQPAARRPPFTEEEFLNYLYFEGAESAANLYRKLRAEFPDDLIFREAALNQIGFNRLYRGEVAEAIRVYKINVEAFPASANAYESLAQAYQFAGDKEQAKLNYKKSLELNPNNEKAKSQLKRLEEK